MKRSILLAMAFLFVACASVLGLRATAPTPFPHRSHVLDGIACTDCHTTVAAATSSTAIELPQDDACFACHPDPHDTRPCLACHGDPETPYRAQLARQYLRFDHREHLPTVDGQCVRCHVGVREPGTPLMPRMGTCLGCHGHDDDFEMRRCDRCHISLESESVVPSSHVVHAEDFVSSHGPQASASASLCRTCHDERQCASCHGVSVPALGWRLDIGTPRREGLHRAGFRARHKIEARLDPGSCASCHAPSTCQSCHVDEGVASGTRVSPHPPDWVRGGSNRHGLAARRDPLSCASCHGGAGEALCVDCHRVGAIGGSPHPAGYSSTKNASRDLPCRLCHAI